MKNLRMPPHSRDTPELTIPSMIGVSDELIVARLAFSLFLGAAILLVPSRDRAVARTVIQQDSPPPRSRLVTVDQPGPKSALIPIDRDLGSHGLMREGITEGQFPSDPEFRSAQRPLPYRIRPSLGGGMPSGFVGGWGDYFLAGSAATPDKLRDGVPDGSINMGFGFGDPRRSLGVELYWGISSIKDFNAGGSFGVSAGRSIVNQPNLQVAVAGGLIDAFTYSNEPGVTPVNGYGAVTVAIPLRPNNQYFQQFVQFTVGGGGYGFAQIDSGFQSSTSGYFAAAGVEALPNLGLSFGVSNRGKNVNLSYVPFRSLPIFLNLAGVDLFNDTPWGAVGILTVGWSDSLRSGP